MDRARTATNDYERNILHHVEKFGCSVTSVFDPDGANPPFSYSIGIAQSCGAPELIIVGLDSKLAHSLINVYNDRVRAGERLATGVPHLGFLEGFAVQFAPVAREHRVEYMRSACWLHGGSDFEALQLIWPSKQGTWPWHPDAPDGLRVAQPLLSSI